MVKSISSGLMLGMQNFGGSKKLDSVRMFAHISATVGGDGRTIKREQLQHFINNVEQGTSAIKISQKQLKAYKQLDTYWNQLFGDKEEITAADFEKAIGFFINVMVNDEDDDNEKFSEELREKTKKYMEELSEKLNGDKEKSPSIKQLKDYLSELIKNNDENKNDEEIAKIVNLIAEKENPQENTYSA